MNNFEILVIDDNQNNLIAMDVILKTIPSCFPTYVVNGDETLKMLSKKTFNLILLDIKLPDINGYELLKIIKSRKKTANIPVVLVTGIYLDENDKKYGFELGAIDYILKPYTTIEVKNKINQYINSFKEIQYYMMELESTNKLLETQNRTLQETSKKIEYLTYHDSLTGLYNRNYFDQYLLNVRIVDLLPLCIIMVDMNSLKLINDAFGHHKGDQLLCTAANYLNSVIREKDIISRWGGDEFLILMPLTEYNEAKDILQKLTSKQFKDVEDFNNPHFSVGISSIISPTQTINDAIKVAENRMYRNKLMDSKSYRSSIINSLKESLHEKDFETLEHTERLNKLSLKMASKMELNVNEKDELSLLASLHDIGKLAIPEEILLKPSRLTEEEWQVVKRHPEVGYNICKTIPELVPIAETILCHHEWWNGQGYPRGLAKENIPLQSRIITIIDSYDVMTNKRPYKEPLSHEYAINELKKCSGTQFEANLVDVFISLFD